MREGIWREGMGGEGMGGEGMGGEGIFNIPQFISDVMIERLVGDLNWAKKKGGGVCIFFSVQF